MGVGWQRRCETCQSLRELDNQGTVCFFVVVTMMVIELDNIVRGGEPSLRTREMIASRSVNMVRHPRGSCIVIPIAISGVVTPEKKFNSLTLSSTSKESRHKVPKSVVQAVLGRMRFTLHATRRTPHGASRLVQAMHAWLVKTRRAPSRIVGMRGPMVIRLRPCTN